MSDGAREGSVHDALLDRIGAAIVDGVYPPGSRLLTTELAGEAAASRGAAREAVRVLESLGLVSVRRRAGIEVRPIGEWNVYAPEVIQWRLAGPGRADQLRELSQLRSAVKPLAVRLAAVHADDAQRGDLVAAVLEMSAHAHDAEGAEYLGADVRFHRTLLAASSNRMLAALGDVIQTVLEGRTRLDLMPSDADPQALKWHRDVAFAVAAGDAEAAAAAMACIVSEADSAVRRLVQ